MKRVQDRMRGEVVSGIKESFWFTPNLWMLNRAVINGECIKRNFIHTCRGWMNKWGPTQQSIF